jgi:ABC-type dipeptide/oligopeptide/nickel transport system permease subunit
MMSTLTALSARKKSRTAQVFRWLWRHAGITFGGAIIAAIVIAGLLAPWITGHDPYTQDLLNTLLSPSADHLFGTDDYGRDIFARVIYGARISIVEVVLSVGLAMLIGIPLGNYVGDGHAVCVSRYRSGDSGGQHSGRRSD